MIIVNCKNYPNININVFYCVRNDYITSVEHIDNEFDDVLFKRSISYGIFHRNKYNEFHNPIGPAVITDKGLKDERKYYYINGKLIDK